MNARYTVNLQDVFGVKATATAYVTVLGTATATNVAADLATFAGNIASLSSAKVIGMEATLLSTASPVGNDPAGFADSNVSEMVEISFPVATTGRLWTLAIPARADSAIVAGGLDDGNAGYIALAAEMSSAGTYSTFTDPLWLALGSVKKTFLSNRKHLRRDLELSTRYPGA
jgi:hypothetical protein